MGRRTKGSGISQDGIPKQDSAGPDILASTPIQERRTTLTESEERYRAFFSQSSEGIWRFELEKPLAIDLPLDEQVDWAYEYGYLAECNDAMARQYGYDSAENLLGVRLANLLVRDDPNNTEFIKAFIKSGYRLNDAESHERDVDGNDRFFVNNFIGIVQNGFLLRAWGSQRDVTTSKAEEQIRARLAAIVESSDDAIISFDLNSTITSWNAAAERIYGYSDIEAIGKPMAMLIPKRRINEENLILERIRRGEKVEHFETQRQTKSGRIVEVSLAISPIRDKTGNVIGISKITRDVSERKATERELDENRLMLAMAMQSSRMGVWERDIATGQITWSEELEVIFGLAPGEFRGTDEHYYSLIHPDDRESTRKEVDRAVAEKRPYSVEFRFYHSDGSIRWMEGRGEAVYSEHGEPVRLYGIGLDVTERKQADQRLRESEERFRLALSSEVVTVYEQDFDLRYKWLYPSEPYPADYIGKTDEDLAPGRYGENLAKLKRQVLGSGKPLRAEVSAPVGDEEKWFDLLIEPRFDPSGKVIGVVGTALDISTRKRAEQQLKRQAVLMDAALEPVIVWEFGGKIIDWNRGAERVYGFTSDEAVGNISHELLSTKFPTDLSKIEEELKASGSWIGELNHTTRSRETIIVESRQQLIEVGNKVLVLEANRDITERKRVSEELQRSEARLQAMFDSTTVGIAVLDLDYRFLQMNDAFCDITGYPRTELIATDWTTLTQTGDLSNIIIGVDRLKKGQVSHLTFEKRYLRKGGSLVWVQSSVSLTRDEKGEPLHLIAISQDISARKAAEEQLELLSRMPAENPHPVFRISRTGELLYSNPASAELHTSWKEQGVEIANELLAAVQNSYTSAQKQEIELEYGDRVFHMTVAPVTEAGYVNIYGTDITAAKRALVALQESEQRFSRFMQQLPGLAWIKDINGRYVYANESAEKSFGIAKDKLYGKTDDEVFPAEFAAQFKEHDRLALESDSGRQFLESLVEADGTHYSIVSKFPISDSRGEIALVGGMAIDITEQKQAEFDLRRQMEFDEAVMSNMAEGLFTVDVEGKVTSINPAAQQLLGWKFDELLGKVIHDAVHYRHQDGREFPASECSLLDSIRSGNVLVNREDVFIRKDASAFDVLLSAAPIRSEDRITGGVVVFQDVTERKRQERNHEFLLRLADVIRAEADPPSLLDRSMKLLGEHLSLGRCFFSTVDLEHRMSTVVGEFLDTTLTPLEKVVSFDDYSDDNLQSAIAGKTIVVEDTRSDTRTEGKYSVSYGPESIASYVAVPQMRDGLWSGILFASRSEPYHWAPGEIALVQTVSERVWLAFEKLRSEAALRESERRAMEEYQRLLERIVPLAETLGAARDLHTIYRSLQEFICASMECSGFFVSFYDQQNQLRLPAFVWGEGEEIDVAKLPAMPIGPGGGPNSRAILAKQTVITNNYFDDQKKRPHVVLRENGIDPMSSLVVPMVVQDRVMGTLEVQAYRNGAFDREHSIALEMATNLAAVAIENVRLIETEARARSEAETANRMKDEFLSVLSHELRTPLNAMLGWVRILRGGNVDAERMTKALEIIERNTRQQSSLIEDLLDVSRIISGKMRIENELIDLIPSLEQAAESVRPIAFAKAVDFDVDIAREPIYLKGDAVRLQQVITNLLQNAIKFTAAGGKVSLKWRREGSNVVIEVTDNGIGIDPEFLPMIFDRFSQADASTRRSNTGLGLGLTIVRTIVELHNGVALAHSEGPGRGAVFTVTLPLAEEFYKLELPRAEPLKSNGSSSSLEGVRILVVDDDQDGLMPLRIMLEKERAAVTCVLSAGDALDELGKNDFDILISDIGMPSMDGFELIAKVKGDRGNRNYSVRAIAYTAYASEEDKNRILSSGYEVHLAKPLDMEDLLSIVRNFSSQKKLKSNGN